MQEKSDMAQIIRNPGAVIAGGSFHSLGAARNLAKNGVRVYVFDSGICVTKFSKYVDRFIKMSACE